MEQNSVLVRCWEVMHCIHIAFGSKALSGHILLCKENVHIPKWETGTLKSLCSLQMIDGEAFLLLTQADIVKIMSVKLGPALKIYNAILMFKNADDTLKWTTWSSLWLPPQTGAAKSLVCLSQQSGDLPDCCSCKILPILLSLWVFVFVYMPNSSPVCLPLSPTRHSEYCPALPGSSSGAPALSFFIPQTPLNLFFLMVSKAQNESLRLFVCWWTRTFSYYCPGSYIQKCAWLCMWGQIASYWWPLYPAIQIQLLSNIRK